MPSLHVTLVVSESIQPLDLSLSEPFFDLYLNNLSNLWTYFVSTPIDMPEDLQKIIDTYNEWVTLNWKGLKGYSLRNSDLMSRKTPFSRAINDLETRLPSLLTNKTLEIYDYLLELIQVSDLSDYYLPSSAEKNEEGFKILDNARSPNDYLAEYVYDKNVPWTIEPKYSFPWDKNPNSIYVDVSPKGSIDIYELLSGPLNLYHTYRVAKDVLEKKATEKGRITDKALNDAAKRILSIGMMS